MPVYEYECNACNLRFEEQQKMADPPIRVCPKCKKRKVERLISATSFILKGGGWYKDLYSSNKSGDSSSSKEDSSSSDAKASDTKSADAKVADAKASDTKSADAKVATSADKPASKESTASKESKASGKKAAATK